MERLTINRFDDTRRIADDVEAPRASGMTIIQPIAAQPVLMPATGGELIPTARKSAAPANGGGSGGIVAKGRIVPETRRPVAAAPLTARPRAAEPTPAAKPGTAAADAATRQKIGVGITLAFLVLALFFLDDE